MQRYKNLGYSTTDVTHKKKHNPRTHHIWSNHVTVQVHTAIWSGSMTNGQFTDNIMWNAPPFIYDVSDTPIWCCDAIYSTTLPHYGARPLVT